MFKIIKLQELPAQYDEYDNGDFIVVGDVVNVVYALNGVKSTYSIPIEVFSVLVARYSNNSIINILKDLSGKYSADDIIKFKTNNLI